jgi:hypothetical protein
MSSDTTSLSDKILPSLNTAPTKAHLELANHVLFSRDAAGRLLTAPMAAQLIADSEARACDRLRHEAELDEQLQAVTENSLKIVTAERDELRDLLTEWKVSAHIKGEAIDSLLIECDQLYAEVERLTSVVLRKNGTIDGTEEMLGGLKQGEGYWDMVRRVVATAARAERAEAEVEGLKESILVQQIFSDDRQRADRAEAELREMGTAKLRWEMLAVNRGDQVQRAEAELAAELARSAKLVEGIKSILPKPPYHPDLEPEWLYLSGLLNELKGKQENVP